MAALPKMIAGARLPCSNVCSGQCAPKARHGGLTRHPAQREANGDAS
jgi:hypothetical protein